MDDLIKRLETPHDNYANLDDAIDDMRLAADKLKALYAAGKDIDNAFNGRYIPDPGELDEAINRLKEAMKK